MPISVLSPLALDKNLSTNGLMPSVTWSLNFIRHYADVVMGYDNAMMFSNTLRFIF